MNKLETLHAAAQRFADAGANPEHVEKLKLLLTQSAEAAAAARTLIKALEDTTQMQKELRAAIRAAMAECEESMEQTQMPHAGDAVH